MIVGKNHSLRPRDPYLEKVCYVRYNRSFDAPLSTLIEYLGIAL